MTLAPGLLAAPALLMIAGFLDGGAQAGLWIVALLIDYGTPYVRDVSGFRVSASHFAERFGLIVIIALGESIVAIGAGLEGDPLDRRRDRRRGRRDLARRSPSGGPTSTSSRSSPSASWPRPRAIERNRLARDSWGVMHGLLIAGIILTALGVKKTIGDVDEPLKTVPAVALCGGVALYLFGHVAIRLRSVRLAQPPAAASPAWSRSP